jgi:ionotropic glutamate receptor
MRTIEDAWFKEPSCLVSNSEVSSNNNLGLESFWGLFLIAGIASLLALLIFVVTFLYQHKHIWLSNDQNTSIWRRVSILVRIFDQRDPNCNTFKKSENKNGSSNSPRHDDLCAVEASLGTHCPPSPSSQTESNVSFYGDYSSNTEMDVVQITNKEVAPVNNCEINSQATANMTSSTFVTSSS